MKVSVSEKKCTGQGMCWMSAPTVFSSDDIGFNAWQGKTEEVPDSKKAEAIAGVRSCPEKAISVVDE